MTDDQPPVSPPQPSQSPVSRSQLEAARAEVIERLSAHFAHDHLTLAELEARLELAYQATQLPALRELTADLPAVETLHVPPEQASATDVAAAAGSKTVLALMGGVVRRGVWTVPRRIYAIAVMGGVELDLREARLAPGVTEIVAFALMGGVVVRVPPGVHLESDGLAIMGGFEDQLHRPAVAAPGAPLVRVTGFALMGGVEAKVSLPGVEDDRQPAEGDAGRLPPAAK